MTKKIKLGFVGLRNIGRNHVRLASALDNAEICAFADTSNERLAESREIASETKCFNDANQLFAEPDIDAVVLSLPNHLHAPLSISALNAGKDVLVEKPMCMTTGEAEDMIAAKNSSGKTLMIGMNQRFNKQISAYKKEIGSGTIGRITHAKTRWNSNNPGNGLWGRGDWFLSKENSGGGPLIDLGIHRLDLALYLMDFPKITSVNGMTFSGIGVNEAARRKKEYGIEDGGIGIIRFENGSSLLLEASYFINELESHQDTWLYGELGTLKWDDQPQMFIRSEEEFKSLDIQEDENSSTSCVEHFVNVLSGSESLIPTPEQGLIGVQIIEALYESAATGKTIYF